MAINIRRRQFIAMLGSAAAALPLAARAQQPVPVIGFLQPTSRDANETRLRAFRRGLQESGYVEGRNVSIEYRFAENNGDQLATLAADLVRRQVAVITAMPDPAARAAKAATSTIPIVFLTANDPIATGLVSSLNRPGGNATGLANLNQDLTAKRLGLLQDLVPGAMHFAVLVNPNTLTPEAAAEIRKAASSMGKQIDVLTAGNAAEIDMAFERFVQNRVDGLMVRPSPFFVDRRAQLASLAARYRIPVIYHDRQFSEAGGLMSYGTSLVEQLREVGIYVGRILKGEKPADLPVMQPTKFELVINLHAAKALGLEIPPGVLTLADEVIE
jgi:putative ABC transport system substrate-binding protein